MLDSRHFVLPQRRTRVWGVACLNSGGEAREAVYDKFVDCLTSMQTNAIFPQDQYFPSKEAQPPRKGHHENTVGVALDTNFGGRNIVVDCMPSAGRLVWAQDAVPCILPKHTMYHVGLERYLEAEDYLNAQGLWRCCWSENAWDSLCSDTNFARDLAGNSFSSTVNQAVLLTSMVACTDAWMALQKSAGCPNAATEPHGILRRIRKKRPAAEFQPPTLFRSKRKGAKGRKYRRKVEGVDSRKKNSGKKPVATIWQKEKLCLA